MTRRETFSVKINPEIKRKFIASIKEKNLSTCLVAEALFIAWVEGTKNRPRDQKITPGTTIRITQNFPRVVRRERRSSGVTEFKPEDNCYLNTCWSYRRPEKGEILSSLGHVTECECSACRPFVSKFDRDKVARLRREKRLGLVEQQEPA